MAKITGAVSFSVETAKNAQTDEMGEKLTAWIQANPFITLEEKVVVQTDSYFTVLIFYSGQKGGKSPI
ncbi:MAG: hypothetical protein AB1742_10975 [bacterium]